MSNLLEIVNRYYTVVDAHQAEAMREFVTDDIVFTGPTQVTEGADAYIELNAQFLQFHRDTRMKAQFANGDSVCSIYEMDVRTPAGGQITLAMADHLKLIDGRIAEQQIYYDPREFAQAFGM